mgnify:CR=1 FL=1
MSTIIGGGIVSVPYAMTAPGLVNGMVINLVILSMLIFTTHLYLKARDILGFDSISELSYVCFGRSSVFIINLLIAFVIFGILTLYLILFSRITSSLMDFWYLYSSSNSTILDKDTHQDIKMEKQM